MGLFRRRSSRLDRIDETTPHRFRVRLAPGIDRDATIGSLTDRLGRELAATADPNDAATVSIVSTFSPRSAAVQRPLNLLRTAGVDVTGLVLDDLVVDASPKELRQVVRGWMATANKGPSRRRAEALAGADTVAALWDLVRTTEDREQRAAMFVLRCSVFNTAGSERRLLALVALPGALPERMCDDLAQAAIERRHLTELSGGRAVVDVEDLIALAERGGRSATWGLAFAGSLVPPIPPRLRAAIVGLADSNDTEATVAAIGALRWLEPDDEVRAVVDRRLAAGTADERWEALRSGAALFGTEMRPVWHEWLSSRSAPLREVAEQSMAEYGDLDDLDVATAHLAKLIRRTPGAVSWHTPRESHIIGLLSRHRGDPRVETAFEDLYGRWDRLNPDIRDWVGRERPELLPDRIAEASAAGTTGPADDLVAEDVAWPLPSIELGDGVYELWFQNTDMFETRDRFEELCDADPSIRVVDGDREFLHLQVDAADPIASITRLWVDAGGDPSP